jgi:hypothetical protein
MRLGGKRMTKKLLFICLVSLVLVALFIPSCTGTPTTGTIEVKATLDGSPWTGAVDYTLTPTTGSPLSGTTVAKTFTVDASNWTCAYVSGGPGVFVSITPSPTQEVVAGGTKTFTLNFITPVEVDASVTFDSWSINGTPVPPGTYFVTPGTVIDATYKEHVAGNNTGAPVKVHQTAYLTVHNTGFEGVEPGPSIWLHVVNGPGAVTTNPPSDVSNQQATVEGNPVAPCDEVELPYCVDVKLDAEVDLDQVVCTTYTKKINWIGFPSPTDIMFDVTSVSPFCQMTLITWACVELEEGFVDTNAANDCCDPSPMLTLVFVPPGP